MLGLSTLKSVLMGQNMPFLLIAILFMLQTNTLRLSLLGKIEGDSLIVRLFRSIGSGNFQRLISSWPLNAKLCCNRELLGSSLYLPKYILFIGGVLL